MTLLASPVTCLKIFKSAACNQQHTLQQQQLDDMQLHPFVGQFNQRVRSAKESEQLNASEAGSDDINLVIGEAIGRVILFRKVDQYGFSKPNVLLQSRSIVNDVKQDQQQQQQHNVIEENVLCLNIFDINCDGYNEILVGTYGKSMYMFRIADQKSCNDFVLYDKIKFPGPVYSIQCIDINGDGVAECLVASLFSLHVLQANLKEITQTLCSLLQKLKELRELEQLADQ